MFTALILDELKAWILTWLHLEVKKVVADAEAAVVKEVEDVAAPVVADDAPTA